MNKYNLYIESLFKERNTFYSASELNVMICEEFDVESNYARQLISRATKDKIIKSSKPFSFDKGQFFYMHPSQQISLETIREISKKYRKPLYRLLTLLEINEGIVSMYEAEKITSTPVSNEDKYKTISLKKDLKVKTILFMKQIMKLEHVLS